jgi:hypothetical protein
MDQGDANGSGPDSDAEMEDVSQPVEPSTVPDTALHPDPAIHKTASHDGHHASDGSKSSSSSSSSFPWSGGPWSGTGPLGDVVTSVVAGILTSVDAHAIFDNDGNDDVPPNHNTPVTSPVLPPLGPDFYAEYRAACAAYNQAAVEANQAGADQVAFAACASWLG